MNLHLTPRSIYFTRVRQRVCICVGSRLRFAIQHGESQYNVDGQIGGDAPLSKQGEMYMRALPKLIKEKLGDTPLTVRSPDCRSERAADRDRAGLDFDAQAHDSDRFASAVRKAHVEVAGRARRRRL
jgi:hypothetical protein